MYFDCFHSIIWLEHLHRAVFHPRTLPNTCYQISQYLFQSHFFCQQANFHYTCLAKRLLVRFHFFLQTPNYHRKYNLFTHYIGFLNHSSYPRAILRCMFDSTSCRSRIRSLHVCLFLIDLYSSPHSHNGSLFRRTLQMGIEVIKLIIARYHDFRAIS